MSQRAACANQAAEGRAGQQHCDRAGQEFSLQSCVDCCTVHELCMLSPPECGASVGVLCGTQSSCRPASRPLSRTTSWAGGSLHHRGKRGADVREEESRARSRKSAGPGHSTGMRRLKAGKEASRRGVYRHKLAWEMHETSRIAGLIRIQDKRFVVQSMRWHGRAGTGRVHPLVLRGSRAP